MHIHTVECNWQSFIFLWHNYCLGAQYLQPRKLQRPFRCCLRQANFFLNIFCNLEVCLIESLYSILHDMCSFRGCHFKTCLWHEFHKPSWDFGQQSESTFIFLSLNLCAYTLYRTVTRLIFHLNYFQVKRNRYEIRQFKVITKSATFQQAIITSMQRWNKLSVKDSLGPSKCNFIFELTTQELCGLDICAIGSSDLAFIPYKCRRFDSPDLSVPTFGPFGEDLPDSG